MASSVSADWFCSVSKMDELPAKKEHQMLLPYTLLTVPAVCHPTFVCHWELGQLFTPNSAHGRSRWSLPSPADGGSRWSLPSPADSLVNQTDRVDDIPRFSGQ